MGHSKGANDVLLYAARHGDVPRVVNLAGRFHLAEGMEKRFGPAMQIAMRDGEATSGGRLLTRCGGEVGGGGAAREGGPGDGTRRCCR